MYKTILRPILFRFPPETIHRLIMTCLKIGGKIPGGRALIRSLCTYRHPSLEREVFGMRFPNPIGLAAGFDKNAEAYDDISALGFGFVEVGTVTPKPQPGNPRPRLFRLPADQALINRMGFNNHGVENMQRNLRGRDRRTIVGCNLGKNTLTPNEEAPADYLRIFRCLYEYVDYFVVNVSCPNVKNITALQNRESLYEILQGLFDFRRGQNQYRPILIKISPDLDFEQLDDMIAILKETPLDGIVATNTTTSRAGLQTNKKTVNAIGNGGLSGAPLTARSLEVIRYVHEKTEGRYPIIGVGGIMTPEDACNMLDAGASLVQVYTGFIYNGPAFVKRICKLLRQRAEGPTVPVSEKPTETSDQK